MYLRVFVRRPAAAFGDTSAGAAADGCGAGAAAGGEAGGVIGAVEVCAQTGAAIARAAAMATPVKRCFMLVPPGSSGFDITANAFSSRGFRVP
jgi:hypothetical protein